MLDAIIEFFKKLFSSTPTHEAPKQEAPKQEAPKQEAPPTTTPTSSEPDYIIDARSHIGQREIPGSKSNPFYNTLFKEVLGKEYGDETSSCMAFDMWILKRNGYKWLATAWAADMPKVPCIAGDPAHPQLYQMAIKYSSVANSKRHSFFIVGVDKKNGTVDGLGANQGDNVCIVKHKISDLKFVGFPIKATSTPPRDDSSTTDAKPLAWGTSHKTWDTTLVSEITKRDWSGVKMPITKLSVVDNISQLISIMAKYESNFDTNSTYAETGDLQGVISRGLLQISVDSANQKAYGNNVTAKDLHDPLINLKVAVSIMHYQAKKHGVLFDGTKTSGAGSYWSVARASSGSYPKIVKYLESL